MARVPHHSSSTGEAVLVLDRDPVVREALAVVLGAAGFAPWTSADPEAALAMAKSSPFSLALVDAEPPSLNGLATAALLKNEAGITDVILMSGQSTFETLRAAINLGVCDFLRKPFDLNDLALFLKRIKERLELKSSLAEAERRHQDLIQSLPLLVWTLDQELNLRLINQACRTMLGFSPEEASAPQWLIDRVHRDDRDMVRAALSEALASGSPCFLQCRLLHSGGQVVHGILQSLARRSAGAGAGDAPRLEGIFVDITDRVILERALVQNEKLKTLGAISAEVSHEMRNPLMSIAGFARRLGLSDPDRPEVGIIIRESRRLEQLVNRIRDYLKPINALPEPCDLNRIAGDSARMLFAELSDREAWAVLDLDPDLPEVSADPEILSQVVITLMRNAAASLAPGASFLVRSFARGGNLFLEFRTPLHPDLVINPEHLFLPFAEGGQTFGLSLAYRQVRDMGGLLTYGDEPGHAVFLMSLPRRSVPAGPEPPTDETAGGMDNGQCFEESTGALTRRRFDELLAHSLRIAAQDHRFLAVALADVDHFAAYSRDRKPGEVDACLGRIAQALDQAMQDPCRILARFGAQEFAAILPDAEPETARGVAEAMRAAVAALAAPRNGQGTPLTVSLGVVVVAPGMRCAAQDVLVEANKALFLAKEGGRDCVQVLPWPPDPPPFL